MGGRQRRGSRRVARLAAVLLVLAVALPTGAPAGIAGVYCDAYPGPAPARCAFFDPAPTLPLAQSPAGFEDWLSADHQEYGFNSWIFYGQLTEDSGRTSVISLLYQRTDIGDFGTPLYTVAVIYANPAFDGYLFGGNESLLIPQYSINAANPPDPWNISATYYDPRVPGDWATTSVEIVSGQVGQQGAKYRLQANVTDQYGELLTVDGTVEDVMGWVNDGYGPQGFYPQWVVPGQRHSIVNDFAGSVGDYLAFTEDPMAYQGAYYFSAPLLKMEEGFEVGVGLKQPFAVAESGLMWGDNMIQSFDDIAGELLPDARWNSFVVQLPKIGKALMVNEPTTGAGRYRLARLYDVDYPMAPNGTKNGRAWPMTEIKMHPVKGSEWTSPYTDLTYPMKYRIKLPAGPGRPAVDLSLKTIMKDQEIRYKNTDKYEGIMWVTGTLGGKKVRGQAWVELVPQGHL